MRIFLTIVGLIAVALGLLWIGQGTGVIHWPAGSYMLGTQSWAVRGAIVFVVGLLVLWLARRRPSNF
jgi:hypothetical protein